MYSIIFVSNEEYFGLLKIAINSFVKNADQTKVKNIYIVDLGISEENLTYLQKIDKINILKQDKIAYSSGKMEIHTKEWVDCVFRKTKTLKELLKIVDNETLILFDADTVTIKDFSHVIDTNIPIQLCLRENKNNSNPYIGCFVAFNVYDYKPQQIKFVNRWIDKMNKLIENGEKAPYETKALNILVKEYKNGKNNSLFGDVREGIVGASGTDWFEESCVVHMKSNAKNDSPRKDIVKRRIKLVENYSHKDILKYYIDINDN